MAGVGCPGRGHRRGSAVCTSSDTSGSRGSRSGPGLQAGRESHLAQVADQAEADPLGVKGLGEVVHVGVAPAIANAVLNAIGRRVRELSIMAEALL